MVRISSTASSSSVERMIVEDIKYRADAKRFGCFVVVQQSPCGVLSSKNPSSVVVKHALFHFGHPRTIKFKLQSPKCGWQFHGGFNCVLNSLVCLFWAILFNIRQSPCSLPPSWRWFIAFRKDSSTIKLNNLKLLLWHIKLCCPAGMDGAEQAKSNPSGNNLLSYLRHHHNEQITSNELFLWVL